MADRELAYLSDLPTDTGWMPLTLEEGSTGKLWARKEGSRVTLRGSALKAGTAQYLTTATLAAPYRPPSQVRLPIIQSAGIAGFIFISTSGDVRIGPYGTSPTWDGQVTYTI